MKRSSTKSDVASVRTMRTLIIIWLLAFLAVVLFFIYANHVINSDLRLITPPSLSYDGPSPMDVSNADGSVPHWTFDGVVRHNQVNYLSDSQDSGDIQPALGVFAVMPMR